MSFGGHVSAMIKSYKENEALRKRSRERSKHIRKKFAKTKSGVFISSKPITESERTKIQQKVSQENQDRKKKVLILTFSILFCVIVILTGLLLF